VRNDDDAVGFARRLVDRAREPRRDVPPQVGERDAGFGGAGGEVGGMVRHTKHGEPDAVAFEDRVSARRLDVAACPDSGDPGVAEMVERVGQRFLAVVEGMVVGERDAVDAEQP